MENQQSFHRIKKYQDYSSRESKHVADVEHTGLGTLKKIRDADLRSFELKIKTQFETWDLQWEKEIQSKDAEEKTFQYKYRIDELNNLLRNSVDTPYHKDWILAFKKNKTYEILHPRSTLEVQFEKQKKPEKQALLDFPDKPNKETFEPTLNFLDKIFKKSREGKIGAAQALYNQAIQKWTKAVSEVENTNKNIVNIYDNQVSDYNKKIDSIHVKYKNDCIKWDLLYDQFHTNQNANNNIFDKIHQSYISGDASIISEYSRLVIDKINYPTNFPRNFMLDYQEEEKSMVIDFQLPAPEDLPQFSEVKYIVAKKEIKSIPISESQLNKMYDDTIYNIVLSTLNYVFQHDPMNLIGSIVFNGWVNARNKATGQLANSCIISLQANKAEFTAIDLLNVDVKACFKKLKGVGSSKLCGIVAIQPIINVNREDKRFVNSYDVAKILDEGYNLASMGWEDFEHLIRELFQQEFSSNGGEVKVTQASHDGGVDAIAFDPDPIRGGKIVIQAKRYTNTVGVSAIRDLYGTVLNEGASKGILVTTSDFGPDSYEFVKNKPLTLLSGSNLLHLLQKHGHKAHIDIQQAKKIIAGQN